MRVPQVIDAVRHETAHLSRKPRPCLLPETMRLCDRTRELRDAIGCAPAESVARSEHLFGSVARGDQCPSDIAPRYATGW